MSDEVWRGPEELRSFLVPIDSVQRHPRNPRRGDVALVADSLDRNGQTRPIVIWRERDDSFPVIIAGNHTWQAAKRLGWTHIAAVADPAMTEDEAFDFLLADNATSDKADYDETALLAKLQDLYDRGALAGTGFTPDDLDDMMARADKISETARQEFKGGYAETDEEQAARAEQASNQGSVKQLPLSYDAETYRRVTAQLGDLGKRYGTSGVAATVTAVIDEEFEEAWNGE